MLSSRRIQRIFGALAGLLYVASGYHLNGRLAARAGITSAWTSPLVRKQHLCEVSLAPNLRTASAQPSHITRHPDQYLYSHGQAAIYYAAKISPI